MASNKGGELAGAVVVIERRSANVWAANVVGDDGELLTFDTTFPTERGAVLLGERMAKRFGLPIERASYNGR